MALSRHEQDLEYWEKWKKNTSIINQQALLKRLDPLIRSEVNKITGLSVAKRSALKVRAKTLVLESLKTYNPKKAQMNT